MFVIFVFVIGVVIGQEDNTTISSQDERVSKTPPAETHHEGVLQFDNRTATTLKIRVNYTLSSFPDIRWFNVLYWPLHESLPRCNKDITYNDILNKTECGWKMLQVKLATKNIIGHQNYNYEMINLFELEPNQTYGVCVQSNKVKNENNLTLCKLDEDFVTDSEIGEVQHLHLDAETENNTHTKAKWTQPAGFELYENVGYKVCVHYKYNNTDDSSESNNNTREIEEDKILCTNTSHNAWEFNNVENNAMFAKICVDTISIGESWLNGLKSSEKCIYPTDLDCLKGLNINVTTSNDSNGYVFITTGKENCNYDVSIVCHAVPTCKRLSDCRAMNAMYNNGINAHQFSPQKLASYKLLVYHIDADDNKVLMAMKLYDDTTVPEYSENIVTTTNTSISASWKRPWNVFDPVSILSQISNFKQHNFVNFIGCSLTVEETNLKPFKDYNVSFDVSTELLIGRSYQNPSYEFKNSFGVKTNPGVCNEVTEIRIENIIFNTTKAANPTLTFRLPVNRTGIIEKVILTLRRSGFHDIISTLEIPVQDCVTGGNCSKELTVVFRPNTNYTIEMHCENANSTLRGIPAHSFHQTAPAVPELSGENILIISKQIWLRNESSNDFKLTIASDKLDWTAGYIMEAVLCYGNKVSLPNITHGYLNGGLDGPNCTNNMTLKLRKKAHEEITLHNLEYNQNYAAVLYYRNEIAFSYTGYLHFRTRGDPIFDVAAVCFIILIFIILLIFSMYFSRLEKSITTVLKLPDLELFPSSLEGEEFHHPISKFDWKDELQELLREPKIGIKKEFFSLSQKNIHGSRQPTTDVAEHPGNLNKNRYLDIVPYDFARVVLQDLPGKDCENYINATYIHSYYVNCGFIACQGPKESTVQDFWRMVLEKNVRVIVMLTRCIEGREKCFKYWPSFTPLITSSNTSIQLLQETADPSGDFTIRKFLVSQGWDTQEVVQFHFTAWPDKECPRTANFYSFIAEVKSYGLSENSPVVVHCSAGVGRTGTFIALYNLLHEMQDDEKEFIDIYYQVLKMRCLRNYMVQTQSQYIFLYESIFQLFQDNSGELPRNDSMDRISNDLEELSEDESGID